jgi:hypothetical protein
MFTLSIEHGISDYAVWRSAFDRFADARAKGGVTGERIFQPVDDVHRLIIDLDFNAREHAEVFRQFLTDVVWSNPETSPALVGQATTRVLERVNVFVSAPGRADQ